jgi:hypothetical protein
VAEGEVREDLPDDRRIVQRGDQPEAASYHDGSLWCATSPPALILRHVEHDGRCGIEVAPNEPPYRGVRGQARATVLRGGGSVLLEELIQRYLGTTASPLARQLLSRAAEEVAIRLTPIRRSSWDYRRRMTSE